MALHVQPVHSEVVGDELDTLILNKIRIQRFEALDSKSEAPGPHNRTVRRIKPTASCTIVNRTQKKVYLTVYRGR